MLALCALREAEGFDSDTEAKRRVLAAIDTVAGKLGHTRAVCRRSYVHPAVVDAYMKGTLDAVKDRSDEAAVLALLKRRVSNGKKRLYQYGQGRISHAA